MKLKKGLIITGIILAVVVLLVVVRQYTGDETPQGTGNNDINVEEELEETTEIIQKESNPVTVIIED